MVFCNCITLVWHQAQKQGVFLAQSVQQRLVFNPLRDTALSDAVLTDAATSDEVTHTGGFADDIHIFANTSRKLQRAHGITILWTLACGLDVNFRKSKVFGGTPLEAPGGILSNVSVLVLLGHRLSHDGTLLPPDQARLDEVKRRLRRVAHVPGGKQIRENLIAGDVLPVLFGNETVLYKDRELTTLRYEAWEAIRGGKPPSHVMAMEVTLTHFVRSHRVDPVQYVVYTIILNWVRFLGKEHDVQLENALQQLHGKMANRVALQRTGCGGTIFPKVVEAEDTCCGPIAMLWEILRSLGGRGLHCAPYALVPNCLCSPWRLSALASSSTSYAMHCAAGS